MASPVPLVALSLIAGALAGSYAGWPPAAFFGPIPLLVASAVICRVRRAALGLIVCACGGFFAGGAALASDARARALHPPIRALLDGEVAGFALETLGPPGRHDPVPTRLRLTEDASPAGDVVLVRGTLEALFLNGTWTPLGGEGIRLAIAGESAFGRYVPWSAGRTLEAPVAFRRPARYLNDGVPDHEWRLATDGVALAGSIKSGLLVDVVSPGTWIEERAAAVRARVREAIGRYVGRHDPVAAGIVIAVLIGDRTGLPDAVRERMQAAGTYHVVAISGGNIAIFTALALALPMLAGVASRPASSIALLVLTGYAQIVTTGPSVWRATLMASLYLVARALDHRTPPWHALSVAAALMTIVRPLDIADPGFVLTFGATCALLGGARRGLSFADAVATRSVWIRSPPARRMLRWAVASVAASLAVELALTPVSAQAFSRVTSAGLVLNLLAVPLMAVVQISGIAVVLLTSVDPLAHAAGWIAYSSAAALVGSSRLVELVPMLAVRVPPPAAVIVAAYYLGLAALLAPRRGIRMAGAGLVAAAWTGIVSGVSATAHRPAPMLSAPSLRLTVFDVGQAEAMLLEAPGAGPVLVDTAGVPFGDGVDITARVLAPALWGQGIRRLDALLVTHGDPDHMGGAPGVLADFRPRQLWTGVPVPAHTPTRELLESAARAGVRVFTLREGARRPFGQARIRVLHPPEPDWERQRVRNDDSVVLEVLFGDAALLLTGDIGADIERALAPRLTPAPLRILKVAHHGSRTSTSQFLVDTWRPHLAVISTGRGNTFGHPTPEVLDRLRSIGARVLRTDRDGQITIETDGKVVKVRTFWEGQ